MFDQLMGDFQKRQEEMEQQLESMRIEYSYREGFINIAMNGNKKILDLEIDSKKIEEIEALQDHLVLAINEAQDIVNKEVEEKSKSFLDGLMPGGLGSLFS